MKVIFEKDYKPVNKLINGFTEFKNVKFNDEKLFVSSAKYIFKDGRVGFIDSSTEPVIHLQNGDVIKF